MAKGDMMTVSRRRKFREQLRQAGFTRAEAETILDRLEDGLQRNQWTGAETTLGYHGEEEDAPYGFHAFSPRTGCGQFWGVYTLLFQGRKAA